MDRRILPLAGAVGAVLVSSIVVLAAPPAGNKPNKVTIEARPTVITFGTTGGIGGRATGPKLPAGTAVVLEADTVPIDRFVASANGVLSASGEYSFQVSPQANTKYRVTVNSSPRVLSPEILMFVRMKISLRVSDTTPARGQMVRFYGSVTPAHVGHVIRIQKRNADGTFRNVARTSLTAGTASSSRYTGSIRIFVNGAYRVLVASHDDHVKAVSALRLLRVPS